MTLATACPKPGKRSEEDKTVARLVKARDRQRRWRDRAIVKAKGKPRTKVKERNEKRIARKAASYRKVIASDFHRRLRYLAWERSHGTCECAECVKIRKMMMTAYVRGFGEHDPVKAFALYPTTWTKERVALAFAEIPIWFVKGGGAAWRRFRSDRGETHHTGYRLFGEENEAELELVQFTWDVCHQRIEAEHGSRRRFLKQGR